MATLLGVKIRQLRKQLDLSLEQLALMSDTSKSYLWELENRETANPTMDKIAKIAEQLKVTSEFLLDVEQMDSSDEIADRAFFRNYKKLPTKTKQKIQEILKVIQEPDQDKA